MKWNSPYPPCVIDFDQQFYSLFITPLRSCFSPTETIKRWLFIFITWIFLKADINNARNCSQIPSDITNNSNSIWSLQIWNPIRHCSLKAFSEYFTRRRALKLEALQKSSPIKCILTFSCLLLIIAIVSLFYRVWSELGRSHPLYLTNINL